MSDPVLTQATVLDAVHDAVRALDTFGLADTGLQRHPTEVALDPLRRRAGWAEVLCDPCGRRLCWAVLPITGTTLAFANRIKGPKQRRGDESDAIDEVGRGPMHDATARVDFSHDRWRFRCKWCHAQQPLRADTALRLYLRAVAEAALRGDRPCMRLGTG